METVTRHVELDISPDALWAAITERDTLEAWLGERVDVDVRPGGTGVIVDDGVVRDVVVRNVDEGRGWTFEWSVDDEPVSTVSFEISTAGGASVLTITETLHADAKADAGVSGFRWDLCALLLWACTVAVALVR
jgi:uncharacterized protein YndB with AHSA1/START domain